MNLRAWFTRLLALFRKRHLEKEINEDIRAHLEMATEENLRRGMSPREAVQAARRNFGAAEPMKEELRDQRGFSVLESPFRDARFGLRTLGRSPSFTLVAVLTLGLGIGANTAIFSLVDAVLLQPLPFDDPDRLVMIWEDATKLGYPQTEAAPGNFLDWKSQATSFQDLAAYYGDALNLTGSGSPERIDVVRVTPNLLSLLGVEPALGRWFVETETPAGDFRVALLTHSLWERRFGSDPGVVGHRILLDDQLYVVVGVMPKGFRFPHSDTQLWVPISSRIEPGSARRDRHFLRVVGRLQPATSLQQAQSEMQTIAQRLAETYPEIKTQGAVVVPLQQEFAREVRTPFFLLLAASGLILAIACANVANMLVTRGVGRQREIAVRSALGASRLQVGRQLLVEGLLLSGAGGLMGVLVAVAAFQALEILVPPALAGVVQPTLNLRLLSFTLLVSFGTGILFGLVPLRQAWRFDLSKSLAGRTATAQSRDRSRAVIVSLQTALAVVVVASTGLMIRTILNVEAVDPGFRAEHVLTARLELSSTQYATVKDRVAFYRDILERIETLPGVVSAGLTTFLPYTNFGGTSELSIEGRPDVPDAVRMAWRRETTPRYLAAIGVPLLKGRWFSEQDHPDSTPVAIVSEQAARLFDSDPIGQRLRLGNGPWMTVVGVVGDIREEGLETAPQRPAVYTPYTQILRTWYFNPRDLVVRVEGDPTSFVPAVQQAIWSINPNQPISRIRTMEAVVDAQVSNRKVHVALLSSFSGLALFLASLGVYALLSFVVTTRRQEFGLRMALGAQAQDLVFSVFRQSFLWIGSGVTIGLVVTLVVTRSMATLLYGVEPTDPVSLTAAVLLLVAVGALAASVPAWRATKVDPMTALRSE
jgi:putative ABC transport system permease protein